MCRSGRSQKGQKKQGGGGGGGGEEGNFAHDV